MAVGDLARLEGKRVAEVAVQTGFNWHIFSMIETQKESGTHGPSEDELIGHLNISPPYSDCL